MVKSYEDEMEFEALFEQSDRGPVVDIAPGDEVVGTVIHVGTNGVQLEVNGVDAMLDASQLGEKGAPAVGEQVRCYVLRWRGRTLEVGTRLGRDKQNKVALQTAMDSGLPIEGKVVETNKGGYVVEIGANRGFCPHAQIDIARVEEPQTLVGRTMLFKVTEMRDGRDPIVSRRAVLQAEREALAAETRDQLVVGARFKGRVTSIRDFGFFVDIGGLEGLVHVSELPYGKKRPHEVVKTGETLEVEVIRLEPASDERDMRIGLSMRALADDPFIAAGAELAAGSVARGVITRIQPYGAFVELAAGVEGLLHISAFGKRIMSVRSEVSVGDQVIVRIKEIDTELRRMSLARVEEQDLDQVLDKSAVIVGNSLNIEVLGIARETEQRDVEGEAGAAAKAEKRPPPAVGTMLRVTVDRHMRFGLLVRWDEALGSPAEGMIPTNDLNVSVSTELRKKYPVGMEFDAVVTDIRADGRVRLSKRAAADHKERAEAQAYLAEQEEQRKATSTEIGTFGELLKAKLGL